MFPEYRDLMSSLKGRDAHFTRLFDRHNELDHLIQNMASNLVKATDVEIENLKKEKLQLKDQLYAHLKKVGANGHP
ncbi:YdcH family protein [Hydrogenophaga sp. OTU3427]|uniref:YdcH family protein n=1 Tax=Hydrogenophaga sp. OTU3427 TaxID=3043856 RepID=UPI00313AF78C